MCMVDQLLRWRKAEYAQIKCYCVIRSVVLTYFNSYYNYILYYSVLFTQSPDNGFHFEDPTFIGCEVFTPQWLPQHSHLYLPQLKGTLETLGDMYDLLKESQKAKQSKPQHKRTPNKPKTNERWHNAYNK